MAMVVATGGWVLPSHTNSLTSPAPASNSWLCSGAQVNIEMQRVPKTAWHWRVSGKILKPVPQRLSLFFPPPYLAQAQHIVGAHEMFVHWMVDPWAGGSSGRQRAMKDTLTLLPLRPSATYSITYKRAFYTFVSLSHSFHPKPLILTHLCLVSSLVTSFSSGDLWASSSAAPLLFFFIWPLLPSSTMSCSGSAAMQGTTISWSSPGPRFTWPHGRSHKAADHTGMGRQQVGWEGSRPEWVRCIHRPEFISLSPAHPPQLEN